MTTTPTNPTTTNTTDHHQHQLASLPEDTESTGMGLPAAAAKAPPDSLYDSLLRYHMDHDAGNDDSSSNLDPSTRTVYSVRSDDDRKIPASKPPSAEDRKRTARPPDGMYDGTYREPIRRPYRPSSAGNSSSLTNHEQTTNTRNDAQQAEADKQEGLDAQRNNHNNNSDEDEEAQSASASLNLKPRAQPIMVAAEDGHSLRETTATQNRNNTTTAAMRHNGNSNDQERQHGPWNNPTYHSRDVEQKRQVTTMSQPPHRQRPDIIVPSPLHLTPMSPEERPHHEGSLETTRSAANIGPQRQQQQQQIHGNHMHQHASTKPLQSSSSMYPPVTSWGSLAKQQGQLSSSFSGLRRPDGEGAGSPPKNNASVPTTGRTGTGGDDRLLEESRGGNPVHSSPSTDPHAGRLQNPRDETDLLSRHPELATEDRLQPQVERSQQSQVDYNTAESMIETANMPPDANKEQLRILQQIQAERERKEMELVLELSQQQTTNTVRQQGDDDDMDGDVQRALRLSQEEEARRLAMEERLLQESLREAAAQSSKADNAKDDEDEIALALRLSQEEAEREQALKHARELLSQQAEEEELRKVLERSMMETSLQSDSNLNFREEIDDDAAMGMRLSRAEEQAGQASLQTDPNPPGLPTNDREDIDEDAALAMRLSCAEEQVARTSLQSNSNRPETMSNFQEEMDDDSALALRLSRSELRADLNHQDIDEDAALALRLSRAEEQAAAAARSQQEDNDDDFSNALAGIDFDQGGYEEDDTMRESLVRQGQEQTRRAMAQGQSQTIQCQGCFGRLHAPLNCSLVFCPTCSTVSPTGLGSGGSSHSP